MLLSTGLILGAVACGSSDASAPTSSTTQTEPPIATTNSGRETSSTLAATLDAPVSTDASDGPTVPLVAEVDDSAAIETTRALFSAIGPDTPGCTVAVARDGQLIWAEAFGAAHLDPLTPMTTESVVDIGSTSKQFTASAIGLLANDGLVDLSAPLSAYVQGLPAWADQTTITQLIHHTSGIPDYIGLLLANGFAFTDVTTDADAMAALADAGNLDFAPGSNWAYSNSNYFLLSQVVLSVTGADLGTFLASRVFTPLSMDAVMDPQTRNPLKAASYEADEADGWLAADSPWQQLGDGAIQTTPTELLKWAGQYWEPTIGGSALNTLRWKDVAELPANDIEGSYGFGIIETEFDGERALSHGGGWGGFVTTFVVLPDQRLAVAGTCNAGAVVPVTGRGDIGFDIAAAFSQSA